MADTISPEARSRIMARVKSKGMKPEMRVRRLLHGLGYRYRLHRSDLPGRPDLVFQARRKVVFVNGCFWHRHDGCSKVRIPATNRDYWLAKLERNHARDARNIALLEEQGWAVLTVWECQLRDLPAAINQLVDFLGSSNIDWRERNQ
jgi:DNA mismatch endonuclease (patch repair protein)